MNDIELYFSYVFNPKSFENSHINKKNIKRLLQPRGEFNRGVYGMLFFSRMERLWP